MFEIINAPINVIAFRFSDKLTAEDVKHYAIFFKDKLKQGGRFGALCDFTGVSGIAADAVAPGMEADLDFLRHIGQIGRFAFISNKEWPGTGIGLLSPLLAQLEMKSFTPEESEHAMQWAADIAQKPAGKDKPEVPSVRLLPTSREDALAFEINDVISSDAIAPVMAEMNKFLERHDKVRMLGRINHFGGVDPTVFMQSGLLSMKLATVHKVERYAIVGAPEWMRKAIKALDPLFKDMEMRTFPKERESDAWAWIGAEPAVSGNAAQAK